MEGFFKRSELKLVKAPVTMVAQCGACGLLESGCRTPKMPPSGKGRRRILVVGEAPGADEDRNGVQFVGVTGQLLRDTLKRLRLDPNRDCWFTNALICRPPKNEIKDEKMIDYCRPNLIKTIDELQPEIIIPLGKSAVKSLIGWLWNHDVGEIGRWVGWQIPCQKLNTWICPTYHPSYVLRAKEQVLDQMFEDHLARAVSLEGRPWRKVPDYRSKVRIILNPDEAAAQLDKYLQVTGTLAFDFETDRLKPDNKDGRIVCCSVCWEGKESVVFPWCGKVIHRMRDLLASPQYRKIGYNIKFEDRWVRAKLGVQVQGWLWDGMLGAHVLDHRPDITGLKFQAFVRLGQPGYNEHIEDSLKPKEGGGNAQNRIHEVSLNDLLMYCGLDSLLEYKVGTLQMEALGYGRTDRF